MTSVEDQIAVLERECAAALLRGDDAACATVLGDEYTLVEIVENQPLQVVLRDKWLALAKTNSATGIDVNDVAVSVYGEIAIAVVSLTIHTDSGSNQIAVTDLWQKRGQDWSLIQRHQSRPLAETV
jgi:hypothetical protein